MFIASNMKTMIAIDCTAAVYKPLVAIYPLVADTTYFQVIAGQMTFFYITRDRRSAEWCYCTFHRKLLQLVQTTLHIPAQ